MFTINDIKNFIIVFIILFIIDAIYLYIYQDWYKYETYRSQGTPLKIKWIGVIFRYIAQSLGLYIFILRNKLNLHQF
jgi:hypothetical protein